MLLLSGPSIIRAPQPPGPLPARGSLAGAGTSWLPPGSTDSRDSLAQSLLGSCILLNGSHSQPLGLFDLVISMFLQPVQFSPSVPSNWHVMMAMYIMGLKKDLIYLWRMHTSIAMSQGGVQPCAPGDPNSFPARREGSVQMGIPTFGCYIHSSWCSDRDH